MSCGIGQRRSSDPMLLWLWCRPAATTPIRPLAWDPPYVSGAAPPKKNQKKTNKKESYLSPSYLFLKSYQVPNYFSPIIPVSGKFSMLFCTCTILFISFISLFKPSLHLGELCTPSCSLSSFDIHPCPAKYVDILSHFQLRSRSSSAPAPHPAFPACPSH